MRIVAGEARSRVILAPEGRDTRPTLDRVRENLFNILQWSCRDASVLDLFAGSGALALEAISRGAAEAVLVDKDPRAVKVEKENIAALRFGDRARVIQADWEEAVNKLAAEKKSFSLIFLDPPYAMADMSGVFASLQRRGLIRQDTLIVLEHEAAKTPFVGEGFTCVDERKYGYVGIRIFRLMETA